MLTYKVKESGNQINAFWMLKKDIVIALNAKFQPKHIKQSYLQLTLLEYVHARHNL